VRVRSIAAALAAAAALSLTAPQTASADSKTEQFLARTALLGSPSQWGLVQRLSGVLQKDDFIAYADRGWARKVKTGAYLRIGQSFDEERRAGFYIGLEQESVRLMFKVDLGVPE